MIDMRSSMSNGVFSGMHQRSSRVAVAPPLKRYMGLADVGILEVPDADGLRIGARRTRSPVNHSMRSVSWIASPTMGPMLFENGRVQAAGMFPSRLSRHDLADAAFVDRLLRHAVT